jgi:hypothetical protein
MQEERLKGKTKATSETKLKYMKNGNERLKPEWTSLWAEMSPWAFFFPHENQR